jgi:ribose transport system permease protein
MIGPQGRFLLKNRIYLIFGLAVLSAVALIPDFRTTDVASAVLARVSTDGLVAVGMTVVIIAGQLDLSVGSVVALAGVIALGGQGEIGTWPAIGLALLAGAAVGTVNGLLVVKGGINSFIATLATMIGISGLTFTISGGSPISGVDPTFGALVDTGVLGPLTPRMLLFVGAVLVAHFVLTSTQPGRNVFAVGGAPEVARLSGIATDRYQVGAFVFSGLMAALGGIVLGLSLNTGTPIAGISTLLTVVTAVVIGGTSLTGGSGSVLKTLAGVLLLGVLSTAMNLQGLPVHTQSIINGGVLLAVVLLDSAYSARRARVRGSVPPMSGAPVGPR